MTTFNAEVGRFHYTVMTYRATVAGDVSQYKLDESFGKVEHVIIIADDIMIVGYKPDHSDHNQAFTTLLQTAQKCNVKLTYDKLQYKQDEVEFFVKHIPQVVTRQVKIKCQQSQQCLHQ